MFLLLALAGCATLPTDFERTPSQAVEPTGDTKLGQLFAPRVAAHGGDLSGIHSLRYGTDALAARIGLANAAQRTLDAQYYIWSGDLTGRSVLAALMRAADRGVRVRLLLDDLSEYGYDRALKTFALHPNVQVRMFNPFAERGFLGIQFLTQFSRLNRRMHNKAFVADNQAAIVGGRNIADEYFEAKPEHDYRDFDVLTVGPVVREVSRSFDAYWNSKFAIPVAVLEGEGEPPTRADLRELRERLAAHVRKARRSEYAEAVQGGEFVEEAKSGELSMLWAEAYVVSDAPSKFGTDPEDPSGHLGPQLRSIVEGLDQELFIISPYFVPGESGVELFRKLEQQGVDVRILTNSLASIDSPSFAGYVRYRVPLLRAGVELYELKPSARLPEERKRGGPLGSKGPSGGSLHAKVFIFDRKETFVGSMNLDPRSLRLNSELGVIVESREFAGEVLSTVENQLATGAYRLDLEYAPIMHQPPPRPTMAWDDVDRPKLVWETVSEQGKKKRFETDPETSWWRRFLNGVLSIFVPEGQL
ncbi:phospholipase D family protein [Thiohalorhabdus methylotrophus]|uniref:Phospholipase D family protein n=1 Tax=Thiohalorhabdus methylotrophus TaxID=3242694 RepID=A0ABV4TVT7_9GAMM